MGGESGISTGRLLQAQGKKPGPAAARLLLGRGSQQLISPTFDVTNRSAILRAYGNGASFNAEIQSVDGVGSAEHAAPLVWTGAAILLNDSHNEVLLDRSGRYRVKLLSGDINTLAVFLTYNEVQR